MASQNKTFFDTNILVYQFDRAMPDKRRRAQELVQKGLREQTAVISSQVVQEFLNVALKKFDITIPVEELGLVMLDLLRPLCRHVPSLEFYDRTLGLYRQQSLSFYDALIIQAALDLGCRVLYSEDLQAGHQYGDLTIVNPFKQS